MSNPLSPEKIQELKDTIRQIDDIVKECDRAALAGIDMSTTKAEALANKERAKKMLAVYGKP